MLGTEPLWQPRSRRREARAALLATAARFGLAVDPAARVAALSVGERQRVEILKALVSFGRKQGARILILDEPTAVLTPQESASLFDTLGQMVAAGLAVIFISHKLDEVLRVSQRIAVLRGGRLVGVLPAGGADKAMLAEAMVGRRVAPPIKQGRAPGEVVLQLQDAVVRGDGPRPLLDGVALSLRAGEVLAIAGVAGNGQQALAEVLSGERALDRGTLHVGDRPLPARPRAWVHAGVARIPEDRHAVGVVGDLPLWENALLERYATPAFAHFGLIRRRRAREHAAQLVQRFDVRGTEGGGLDTITRGLSGGNMQKLILGRALSGDAPPRLIVANQPTWGLDIGAVAYVHQQLLDACAAGSALLLISEDLDEIFALADRIAVMHQGRLTAARPRAEWTLAAIGLAMAGTATEAEVTDAA
jgi:simple sugar transport system ATP-binding protein